jgi:phenylpropionate dioxygenase-like ring-hydroxylating dioxygenase large terminal subunit
MQKAEQIALVQRLLHYVDSKTTAMAAAPWRNPVSVYLSPEQLKREQLEFFRRRPLMMGFASEWAQPGDYKTDDLSGQPLLVVRGRDGVLRGFLNVCRHRGSKVVDGCGTAKAFSCAYHAWSYDLAGKVTHIPDERSFPGVKAERPALTAVPLCEKYGLVWLIPTPAGDGAASFDIDPWLGGLGPELAAYDFDPWAHYDTRVLRRKMNWKLAIDTFHEGYHIGALHRDTIASLFVNAVDFTAFGAHLRMAIARSKITRLKAQPQSEWDAIWNTALVYTMVPNAVFVVNGDHVELWRMFPDENRPDRCVMTLSFYVPKAPTTDDERRHWDANVDLTIRTVEREDFPVGEGIQAGFASGAQTHTVFGQNEPAMIHYHRSLAQELGIVPIAAE